MNWKDRVSALPVILPNHQPDDDECLEQDLDNVHVIATHTFMPAVGNTLTFSVSGLRAAVIVLMQHLAAELGEQIAPPYNRGNIWWMSWHSPSDMPPPSEALKRLGETRVNEICNTHGLSANESRTILELLASLDTYANNQSHRLAVFKLYLARHPRGRAKKLIDVLHKIRTELNTIK